MLAHTIFEKCPSCLRQYIKSGQKKMGFIYTWRITGAWEIYTRYGKSRQKSTSADSSGRTSHHRLTFLPSPEGEGGAAFIFRVLSSLSCKTA